ncbi:MAG: peroxiredoxin [Bacteroidia bacterium]|nr:peroxiredoxin [Bacteroidia bacterium]MDW8236045.1 peroxiredoxin [Bacteroidia bacterium]
MRKLLAFFLGASPAQNIIGKEVTPSLSVVDENEREVNLSSLRGKWIVLYFYPYDDTPGCTAQAKEFSRLLPDFEKLGAAVYGVSAQSPNSHRNFKRKHNLQVPLLADTTGKLSDFFGVKRFMGMCSRDVVVINPAGKIALHRQGVSPQTSPSEILEWLRQQPK